MGAYNKGLCFYLTAVFIVIISIIIVAMASINLNNLMFIFSNYLHTSSFMYIGEIGKIPSYCFNDSLMSFCWLSGFWAFFCLLTGFLACGITGTPRNFELLFLFLSGFTTFVPVIIAIISSCFALKCHVTLTGKIPSTTFIVGFLNLFEFFGCLFLFLRVLTLRGQYANDLELGHPLPEPNDLDLDPAKVEYFESSNPMVKEEGGNGENFKLAYNNKTFIQNPSNILNIFDNSTITKKNKVVLNAVNFDEKKNKNEKNFNKATRFIPHF